MAIHLFRQFATDSRFFAHACLANILKNQFNANLLDDMEPTKILMVWLITKELEKSSRAKDELWIEPIGLMNYPKYVGNELSRYKNISPGGYGKQRPRKQVNC